MDKNKPVEGDTVLVCAPGREPIQAVVQYTEDDGCMCDFTVNGEEDNDFFPFEWLTKV